MHTQKHLIYSCVTGLSLLGAFVLLGPGADAMDPRGSDAFHGVLLPYDGSGSIWVLDNGKLVVQLRGEPSDIRPDTDGGRSAVMSIVGADTEGSRAHAAPSIVEVHTFLVPAVAEHSTLLRKDGTWTLLGEDPESKATASADAQFIPLPPSRQNQSGHQSVLDLVGELDITLDPQTGVYTVSAEDWNSGERFVTSFSFGVGEQPSDAIPVAPGCTTNCDNGSCNVTCLPPGSPLCWCDTGGNPHCECITLGR